MRWALVKVAVAVTLMVVLAFAVPLGLVIKEMARDRAFSNAERQAAAIGPTLSITADRDALERAVASTQAGAAGRMAVHVPAAPGGAPVEIGRGRAPRKDLDATRKVVRAYISGVPGGSTLLQPTALSSGEIAIVEVYVPEAEVTNGVATAWLVLAGVGIALVIGSVAVADRLGVRMVRPRSGWRGRRTTWGRGSWGRGCRRRARRSCARQRWHSTRWRTRWSNSSPTSGSWRRTCRTGSAPP